MPIDVRRVLVLGLLLGCVGAMGSACIFIDNAGGNAGFSGAGGTGGTGLPAGKGVGATCASSLECRPPMACDTATSTCQPTAMGVPGASCVVSKDCLPSLHCHLTGMCLARTGNAAVGEYCTTEADCGPGLACNPVGLNGVCATPGTLDVGALCTGSGQCMGGLLCVAGRCGSLLSLPPWRAMCNGAEEAIAKIHFKVPRAAEPAHEDFFSLPFPNDARIVNGKLNMKNFPKPGLRLLPFDPIDRYLRAIEADIDGFALNSRVFFRFSRNLGDNLNARNIVVAWNIDKRSPGYNTQLGHSWGYSPAPGAYICDRWMVLQPGNGRLEPGTTYAVVIRSTAETGARLLDRSGQQFVRDTDFEAMMAATAPADPELAAAWAKYQPLREWLADTNTTVPAADILAAAVFTTQRVDEPIAALRAATAALSAPLLSVSGVVKCGETGAVSPCDDGLTGETKQRGCLPAPSNAAYDEYQGKFVMPVWQQGMRPFEQPVNGGAIRFDATGAPMMAGMEEVCFSLTVPKGTAPTAGWPVVVYAHGTTGSYLSGLRQGWAQDFATGTVPGGAAVPMAMLSYDGALHGPRMGTSTLGVEELVFNVLNPESARDTAVQGAADLFALARVAASYDRMGVKLDPARIVLYGHSQGANAAAIAAGYEPTYKAVVLSGAGGLLARSLTSKTKPINIAGALPFILGDNIDAANPLDHPLITILQTYFERSDPVNFVRRISLAPPMNVGPKNFLHVYGTMDNYSPAPTQQQLGLAAALPVVGTVVDSYGLATVASPLSGNVQVGADRFTAAQIQYAPGAYDGHFVSTQDAGARAAILRALGSTIRDGVATVAR